MIMRWLALLAAVLALFAFSPFALALDPIQLPKPLTEGGKPLMRALKDRKSSRSFSSRKLHPQILSNLLWAANGINRPAEGKRTAPSALNLQPIDVYVAVADGLYLYNAKAHQLDPVSKDDIRAATGGQPFVAQAPLNLVYVADQVKSGRADESWAFADTGFIAQNVYLYCASEGLTTVVRAMVDRTALSNAMKLRPDQKVTLAQTVGYPKK